MNRARVLVAEHDPVLRSIFVKVLREWAYAVLTAASGTEAAAILCGPSPPAIALLDWLLPCVDGLELCRRVRAMARSPGTYTVLICPRSCASELVESRADGADDYLQIPFRSHDLRMRLRAAERILGLDGQLRETATLDPVTGLMKPAAMRHTLERELARVRRERAPVAAIALGLDPLQTASDEAVVRSVVRETARRLKAMVRPYDSLGHWDAAEFLAVLTGTDLAASAAQAERLRLAVEAAAYVVDGTEVEVTCSAGLAWTSDAAGTTAVALAAQAQTALASARAAGCNRVQEAESIRAAR